MKLSGPRQFIAVSSSHARAGKVGLVSALFVVGLVSACNKPPAVNPWRDDSIPSSQYGTPSSEAVLATNVPPAVRVRDFPQERAPQVSYQVPHYPLWWEDPFEDQGDNDHMFAWTWQDYFTMPYGPSRYILNTLAWPVSAVVTPPGAPMVSDGIVGKVHDAKRGYSPNPNATLSDFGFDDAVANGSDAPLAAPATQPR